MSKEIVLECTECAEGRMYMEQPESRKMGDNFGGPVTWSFVRCHDCDTGYFVTATIVKAVAYHETPS